MRYLLVLLMGFMFSQTVELDWVRTGDTVTVTYRATHQIASFKFIVDGADVISADSPIPVSRCDFEHEKVSFINGRLPAGTGRLCTFEVDQDDTDLICMKLARVMFGGHHAYENVGIPPCLP